MARVGTILTSERAAATGVVSLALGYLAAQGVAAPLLLLLASVAVFSYVVITSGQLLLRAAQATDLPLVAAWPLGVTATALALLALLAILPITAAVAFALWAAVIIPLDIATARGRRRDPGPRWTDLAGLTLGCAMTAAWCKALAEVPATFANTGQFAAWIDYLSHARIISQFGDVRAVGRGEMWLADTPRILYHYASYTLPAVFASPLDQPGLPLATSLWVPIGLLSLATAAYALGASLAGAAGGIAALAALMLIPDASNYGLRNGFFSFHWTLFGSPTTSYALGTSLLAIVFLHRWIASRSGIAFTLSAALIVATALFRMHIFVLLLPAWLAIVAAASQTVRQRRIPFLILAGTFAVGVVLALRFGPDLPARVAWVFDEGAALERFLYFAHRGQEPTAYQGLYRRIINEFGEPAGFTIGILLLYPACLGVLVVLYPLALFLLRGKLQLAGVEGFPLALLLAYPVLLLVAPIPVHHDPTDFTHRPFVLLYAVVAVWTATAFVRWLAEQGSHGRRLWQTLAVVSVVAVPFLWATAGTMARPKFYWARPFMEHAADRDLLAAARIVRERARPGDTLAAGALPMPQVSVDAPTELVALTGVPAYVARFWIHDAFGGNTRSVASTRNQALGEVAQARDVTGAMQRLRALGVRWYVVTSPGRPAWDPGHGRAAWAQGAVAIYDSGAEK